MEGNSKGTRERAECKLETREKEGRNKVDTGKGRVDINILSDLVGFYIFLSSYLGASHFLLVKRVIEIS